MQPGARLHELTTARPMNSASVVRHLEVEQRLGTRPGRASSYPPWTRSRDDGAEDDRRDDHLDEADEAVGERLEGLAGCWEEMPDENAQDDGDQHLDVKNAEPPFRPGGHQLNAAGVVPRGRGLGRLFCVCI